jgi:hypothetical protein
MNEKSRNPKAGSHLSAKLLNLEELKKSVLQKAFAGELATEKD